MPKPILQQPKAAAPKPAALSPDDPWGVVEDLPSFLIYGDSATGKTTLWGSIPGKIDVAICSGGGRPGELRSINTPAHRARVKPKIINSINDFTDWVESAQDGTAKVLDHVSGFFSLLTKEMLGMDTIPQVKKWGMAEQRDWGNINDKCIELLRHFLNTTGVRVIVGQERIFKSKQDGNTATDIIKPAIGVSITPGVVNWLRPAVDFEAQTFKRPKMVREELMLDGEKTGEFTETRGKGVEYCLRLESHDIFMTKFRLPKGTPMPDVIVDPTWDKVMKVVRGEWKE